MKDPAEVTDLFPLSVATKRIPGRPHVSTIARWALSSSFALFWGGWRLAGERAQEGEQFDWIVVGCAFVPHC
jgi:hypothetical protein